MDHQVIYNYQACSSSISSSSVQPMADVSSSYNNDSHEMPTYIISQSDHQEDSKSKSGGGSSVKWMSSKMRLMQKMMNPDHIPSAATDKREKNINNTEITFSFNSNNTVRVCSDCNTTTTPLWRSGPRGPKVRT